MPGTGSGAGTPSGIEADRQREMFFRRAGVTIEAFTEDQLLLARQAFHDFGKGRHPAGLNFGDCFAYALARYMGEPLLFKGDDFRQTDIVPAIPQSTPLWNLGGQLPVLFLPRN